MAIGIWTSRIVLNALGFTDQGLYNLVGGFVGFLSILTSSLSSSISRFITYEIGKGSEKKVSEVFQNSISVQLILSLIVLVFAETIGLWFLVHKLVIPENRLFAVHIVYQASILSFILNLWSVSQNAMVIAHEKMNIYAYVSIANAVLSLAIAMTIANSNTDRLILYAALQCLLALLTRLFYTVYVKRNYPYCKFSFKISKSYFKPIFSFAGWNFIGSSAQILRVSGTSVLLNIFGGPIANTINGIANSVNNLSTIFVNDFTTAYTPQITKKYAKEEYDDLSNFLFSCSKYSFFLLAIVAIPVMINIEPLLILWLKKIPEGTAIFARLIIIYSLIECVSKPLITAKNATGNIKAYQLVVGGIALITIPLSYLLLKLDLPLYVTYISMIITAIGTFFARMIMLRGSIPGWSIVAYLKNVIFQCVIVATLGFIVLYYIYKYTQPESFKSIISCCFGALWVMAVCYWFGCNKSEKQYAINAMQSLSKRFINK